MFGRGRGVGGCRRRMRMLEIFVDVLRRWLVFVLVVGERTSRLGECVDKYFFLFT